MKKIYFLGLLLISCAAWLKAQDSTETIAPDRPGFGDAVSIVSLKQLQIETGFWFESDRDRPVTTQGLGLNSTLFRYGISDQVELRLDYNLWRIRVETPRNLDKSTGFFPWRFGMKAALCSNKGALPAVTFIGMMGMPWSASEDFKPDAVSPDLQLSFANAINEWLSICYNLGTSWDGDNPNPETYYALSTEFSFSPKIGAYLQGHGSSQRSSSPGTGFSNTHQIFTEAGLMYYPKANIQIDLSGGIRVSEYDGDWSSYNTNRKYSFGTLGLSWRFPR